jgi:hypothetical protein
MCALSRAQLYRAHQQGAYVGREAEWTRQDADIIAAGIAPTMCFRQVLRDLERRERATRGIETHFGSGSCPRRRDIPWRSGRICDGLTASISRPLYPRKRTLLGAVGTAERCQRRSLPRFAYRDLWNIDATAISFRLDVCRFDDWCPAGNLALYQYGERWLAAPRLVRNVAADFRQPPAHVLVIEGPVERVGEPVKDRLRRSLGSRSMSSRHRGPPLVGL